MRKTLAAIVLSSSSGALLDAFLVPSNPSTPPTTTETTTTTTTTTIPSMDHHPATQEWDVQRYQEEHSFVWEYGSSLVELLDAKPGERILDIGCGTGELTAAIAATAGTGATLGMDSDPSMVRKAQEQFPHLHFFQGDVRSFRVEEPVDAVFSNAALHWVPAKDVDRSVRAISQVLRPGGRFVVELGGKGNVERIVSAVKETLPGVESPWYFPSISEYTTILESKGLEVLSAVLYDRPTTLVDTEDGVKNWLRMFGNSFWEGKDEKEIDLALDEIQAKLKPQLFDGTKWVADYRRLRIVARKIT